MLFAKLLNSQLSKDVSHNGMGNYLLSCYRKCGIIPELKRAPEDRG
ncbi:MAG TPA: hypothetical protein VEL11_02955 [Candidatus Bathyarchaeia archaeon]|nr:hypothetical protein [Candidatus Bathyarchaeia archaeon]